MRRRPIRTPWPDGFIKRITTRVIFPKVRRAEKTHCAPKGKSWTPEAEQKILEDQATLLETRYPEWKWKMIEVDPHVFNFIAEKKDEVANASAS